MKFFNVFALFAAAALAPQAASVKIEEEKSYDQIQHEINEWFPEWKDHAEFNLSDLKKIGEDIETNINEGARLLHSQIDTADHNGDLKITLSELRRAINHTGLHFNNAYRKI